MASKKHHTPWFLLALLVVAAAINEGTPKSKSQVVGPTSPAPILTGKWKLDTGETVDITQSSSGQVTAKFSPAVACWDLSRTNLFSAQIRTTGSGDMATMTLENGSFWACTRNERMWKECGVQKLFETKMRNATVTPFSISGEVLRPGYWLPGGDFRRCRPDAKYEEWAQFSLTPLCRPSTPWFDRGTPCQNSRSPEVLADYLQASVRICGAIFFHYSFSDSQPSPQGYGARLESEILRQIGSRVCCDRFNQPVAAGACDPRLDIDCDGRPNATDVKYVADMSVPLPDINIYSTPPGASVVPFPEGLNPDDPGFVPDSTGCDCKWQLIKGVLNCGTGGQGHSYVATWKCPTTGREVTTTKNASASTPCP